MDMNITSRQHTDNRTGVLMVLIIAMMTLALYTCYNTAIGNYWTQIVIYPMNLKSHLTLWLC